jgi:type II secretory pathway pseudopilin PulG
LDFGSRSEIQNQKSKVRSSGFTLLEGLMAAAVLGIATVAVVGPIMTTRQQREAVAGVSEALGLARQLLEEIAAKPYADPDDGNILLGPDPMESSREWFDNVDDYHGYADTTSSLRTLSGTSLSGTADGSAHYARRVTVEYRAGPDGPAVAAGDFALVRVWVGPENGKDEGVRGGVELSGLMTRVSLRK